MKCIGNGGECGIGGYCSKCPWKRIDELDRAGRILLDALRSISYADTEEMYSLQIQAALLHPEVTRHFPNKED